LLYGELCYIAHVYIMAINYLYVTQKYYQIGSQLLQT